MRPNQGDELTEGESPVPPFDGNARVPHVIEAAAEATVGTDL